MKKLFVLFFTLLCGIFNSVSAQKEALRVYTAATGEKTYIIIVNAPENTEGFRVYKKSAEENEYKLITPQPIVPAIDPAIIKSVLKDDYDWVKNSLGAEDDFEIVRRLQSEAGAAAALSLASINAARAAGRLFIDNQAEEGETYSYKIEFIDYTGKKLGDVERKIMIIDKKPPAPLNAEAEAGDGRIKIAWDFPEYRGDENDIVVGFNIYRIDEKQNPTKINNVLILRQENMKYRTDINVVNNKTYSYFVTSVDCIGRESEPSDTASATPVDKTPPAFPKRLTAIPEEGKVLLSWKMNLELDVDHYDVYRSMEVLGNYEKINSEPVPNDSPFYYDEKVYSGPTYYYKIKAIDFAGNESDFSNSLSGKPADNTPPAAPDSVWTVVRGAGVLLKWNAPADVDLQGYYVYSRRSDQKFLRSVSLPIHADTTEFYDAGYNDEGLWQGRTYYYGVSAVDNVFNESEMKIIRVIIPDNEPPLKPVSAYAGATDEGLVEITWQPSMSLDVAEYRVYRSDDSGESKVVKDLREGVYSAIDSTVMRGKTYGYQVVAVDSSGNESERTEMIRVTSIDATIPPPPGNVKATDIFRGVKISWDAVDAIDLLGYNVYKSDIPNGVKKKLNDKPVQSAEYFDISGVEGMYYSISSLDTSGHENFSGTAEAVKPRKK